MLTSTSTRRRVLAALFLLAASGATASAQVVQNVPATTSGYYLYAGQPYLEQTFTSPNGATVLDDFTFWMTNPDAFSDANLQSFNMRVYQGNTLLYTSGTLFGPASNVPTPYFFSINAAVAGNTLYEAVLTYLGNNGSTQDFPKIQVNIAGAYPGGEADYSNDGANWTPVGRSTDFAFVADFTGGDQVASPEPASLVLLATGFVGFLGVRKFRKSVSLRVKPSALSTPEI